MKNSFFFTLSLICISFLFSCQEENTPPQKLQTDFETLKKEIQATEAHISYMAARKTFYNQLKNQEIDLFGIYAELKSRNINDVCNMDASILDGFKGSEEYISSYCAIIENTKDLHFMFEEIRLLNSEQRSSLFNFTPANETINLRVDDCLANFNHTYNVVLNEFEDCLEHNDPDCLDNYYAGGDQAVETYDNCCNKGGNGCP